MSTLTTSPPLGARQERAGPFIPWGILAIGLSLALAHLPLLAVHVRQLWQRPHYQFLPFVVAGAAFLTYLRLKEPSPLQPGSRRVSSLLLAASWGLLALAGLLFSPWLGAIAALATVAALIFIIGGGALLRRLFPVWAFLWLLIPPPFGLDQALVSSLQTLTARCSSRVLDLLGVFHVPAGHVIEVSNRRFLVEEACSGMHSFFALVPATLFFVLWLRRPLLPAALLFVAVTGWVLVANVARVVGVTFLTSQWGFDVTAAHPWRHEVYGVLVFLLTFGIIAGAEQLVLFFTSQVPPGREKPTMSLGLVPRPMIVSPPADRSPTRLLGWRQTVLTSWPVALAYGALAGAQLWLFWAWTTEMQPAAPRATLHIPELGAEALPARWGPWQRQGFETEQREALSEFGEFSQVWRYQLGGCSAIASLDYPYPGHWHDLTFCYRSQGWAREEYLVRREEPIGGGDEVYVVEAKYSKPLDHYAYLLFTVLDAQGQPVEALREPWEPNGAIGGEVALGDRLVGRLESLWFWQPGGKEVTRPPVSAGPSYQVQLFVTSYAPLSLDEQRQAREFFRQVWSTLRVRCSHAQEGSP